MNATLQIVISVAVIVLIAAGVWALVEGALTLRRVRTTTKSLEDSSEQIVRTLDPILQRADRILADIEPVAARLDTTLETTQESLAAAHTAVDQINGILADVSSVSGMASTVTGAVSSAAERVAQVFVGKHMPPAPDQVLPSQDTAALASSHDNGEAEDTEDVSASEHYVNYTDLTD